MKGIGIAVAFIVSSVAVMSVGGCATTATDRIACSQSALQYTATPFETGGVGYCAREVIPSGRYHKEFNATKEEVVAYRSAFQPEKSLSYSSLLYGTEGQTALLYLSIAPDRSTLKTPDMRAAVMGRLSIINSIPHISTHITWGQHKLIDSYEVDFYQEAEQNSAWKSRPCFIFVRYLIGTPADHSERLTGEYCDDQLESIDDEVARQFLGAIRVQDSLIQWPAAP